MSRPKNSRLAQGYDLMLKLGADTSSDLYFKGRPTSGAAHRECFWKGYFQIAARLDRQSMAWACYQAGKEFRRIQDKDGKALLPSPWKFLGAAA